MNSNKVISQKNLPCRLPLFGNIVVWLLMDRLHAPEWGFAVMWTLMAILWIVAIIGIYNEERKDISSILERL